MGVINLALKVAIAVLMVDSLLELAFISGTVAWLHRRAGRDFEIEYQGGTFPLHGKPLHLLVDHGHTSNGAAGTAFVLIGLGGIMALWLRSRSSRTGKLWYSFWLVMTFPSVLLTLAALIYTFVLTNNHAHHMIDIDFASTLNNLPYPNEDPYPIDMWTPENWFVALLMLPLESNTDRSDVQNMVRIMKGWRWNLIPMLVIGVAVCVLASLDAISHRHEQKRERSDKAKISSA